MKRFLFPIVACALALSSTAVAADNLLAFPGAEGFGRYTTGGRGGEIYHVTNLNDSGTGSLRDAVSKENRIIIFDVSGTINLKSPLVFKGNNTVLGQTAPGEGIQVYGDRVSFSGANNLIVRYIRFRMGVNGTNGADACGVANGTDMIFDHLSVLWGRDENFSVSWDNKNNRPANITIQNSIIGQGLQSHSCGGLIQTIGGVTLYRNLYIENKTRNPKVKGLNQYVNNVVYNWGNGGCYIMSDSEGDSWADIENNYFMRGQWNSATDPFVRGIQSFRYYGAGNYYDDNKDGEINGHEMTVDEMKGAQDGTAPYSTWFSSLDALNANITEYNDTTTKGVSIQLIPEISNKMTALEALNWMTTNVGPSLPAYDEVDQYLIDELMSWGTVGTKNGITSEKQLPHKGTG
ncbi:MAG: Por secretion system protein, partial [Duncaniella sp.]|nr:Por secretion system protein [Duncaniella sp.]